MVGNKVGNFVVGSLAYVNAGPYKGQYVMVEGPAPGKNMAAVFVPISRRLAFDISTFQLTLVQSIPPNLLPSGYVPPFYLPINP